MLGYSMLANFGAKPFETDNEIFGYYQYDSPKFKAYAGVIPRYKEIGDYPSAFLSDSVRYFDPNLTGLLRNTGRPGIRRIRLRLEQYDNQ